MITVTALGPLRRQIGRARASGRSIGLVPTMGALHEGHLALVRLARRKCELVVVSVFVNPLQFGPAEDLARYPRRPAKDAASLAKEGVDLLYRPNASSFYPPDFSTSVEVETVSEGGEGAARPGHFRGVTTAVAKLFLQVQPDAAFFGRKDLQQVAIVRRMVRDLDFPLRLYVGETVREPDGLALSSRNAYLSADERRKAALFARALRSARDRARAGQRDARLLERETRGELERAGFTVDYVEVVDPETMRRLAAARSGAAIAAAIRIGKTRLIDNIALSWKR